jgi:hypothetical protein
MKPNGENSDGGGRNLKKNGMQLSLVSPPKKTASGKITAPAAEASKSGLADSKTSPSLVIGSDSTSKASAPLPVPKPLKESNRLAEALRRLKVKRETLERAPEITPLFNQAEGGLQAVLGAMRFAAQDEVIAAFLKKYDAIPAGDRQSLPWEAIAIAANVDLRHLAGAILFALREMSVNSVKVIAFSQHAAVMRKTIEYAMMPSGDKDRMLVHRGLGFLPDPKGPTFIGKAVFGAAGREKEEPDLAATFDGDDDLDQLFPPANLIEEKLVPIRQRLLPEVRNQK